MSELITSHKKKTLEFSSVIEKIDLEIVAKAALDIERSDYKITFEVSQALDETDADCIEFLADFIADVAAKTRNELEAQINHATGISGKQTTIFDQLAQNVSDSKTI